MMTSEHKSESSEFVWFTRLSPTRPKNELNSDPDLFPSPLVLSPPTLMTLVLASVHFFSKSHEVIVLVYFWSR